jgi:glyoxylase-like metal-dependent hydrolase (beta-lactamase superfamily II)
VMWLTAAAAGAQPQALIHQAVNAMGGEAALAALKTIAIRGSDQQREYESSFEPGAKAELRSAGEAKFFVQRDLAAGNARTDWERRVTRIQPKPLELKYSEIMSNEIGYVAGIDSQARTQVSLKSNPPGHPMSGARAAITLRELTRRSPRLLLDMKANPGAVKAMAAQNVGGRHLPAVQYEVRNYSFTVMFDPASKLPAVIRTRDADPIQGDANYDMTLADWRDVGGAKVAHSLEYHLNGRNTLSIKYDQVAANPPLNASLFEIPTMARAIAVQASRATGGIPHQWMIRRGHWGNLMDSDTVGWDASAFAEPELVDIAPGVSQSRGVSHNSVVIEMDKYLVMLDAPINEQFSEWMIKASKARYPGKPIRYLMLTHHHWDHTSGARTYVAEGATVIVGQGNKAHFTRQFVAPGAALNDRLHHNPRKPNIVEVAGKYLLKDAKREVGMFFIETEHSTGTLIAYIPDAKLGFVTDLWSPGRDPLLAKLRPGELDVVKGLRKWNLDAENFAAGHGTVGAVAPLLKLAGG